LPRPTVRFAMLKDWSRTKLYTSRKLTREKLELLS